MMLLQFACVSQIWPIQDSCLAELGVTVPSDNTTAAHGAVQAGNQHTALHAARGSCMLPVAVACSWTQGSCCTDLAMLHIRL